MQRVGIIAKIHTPGIQDVLKTLEQWLAERHVQAIFERETAKCIERTTDVSSKAELPNLTDFLVVLGGDGTLLSTARLVGERHIPILGVNLGQLGFLAEITLDEMYFALEQVLRDEFTVAPRLLLQTSVTRDEERLTEYSALNDVVINKGALARIIDLQTCINGQYVTTYKADGLIIATTTGSTAYNLSAGGPIVHPDMHALILTPICPHTLTNRPIVIHDTSQIEITLKAQNEDVFLTLDGQVGFALRYRDVIHIQKAKQMIQFIHPSKRNFFEVLRTKLKWGER